MIHHPGFYVPNIYIKDRAIELDIATNEYASYLLAIIGISNTFGRLFFGYISDYPRINRLYVYIFSLLFCGLATMLSEFAKTYTLMGIYAAIYGITSGKFQILNE